MSTGTTTGEVPAPARQRRAAGGADKRFACFDGVRAIAATLIVAHHAGFTSGATYKTWYGKFLGRMDIGVPIFFVLSGFLLYRPFVARLFEHRAAPDARSFWRRRFLRIFPAYWVAFCLILIIGGIAVRKPTDHSTFGGAAGFFFSFTLLHIYHPGRFISGITQSWSLATEISFYAVLPGFAALCGRRLAGRPRNRVAQDLLVILAGVWAFSLVFRVLVAVTDLSFKTTTPYWLLSLCDYFALGMGLAVISVWGDHVPAIRAAGERIGRHAGWCWVGAVAAFWFVSTQLGLPVGLSRAPFEQEVARQLVYGLVGLLLVAPMALGPEGYGPLRKVLSSRPFAYAGTVSYGIYLWHQFFIYPWLPRWFDWKLFDAPFLPMLVLSWICAFAVASVSYHLVEHPVSERFRNGWRPAATRATNATNATPAAG